MPEHTSTAFASPHALHPIPLDPSSLSGRSERPIVRHHTYRIDASIQWDTVNRPLEQVHVARHALRNS